MWCRVRLYVNVRDIDSRDRGVDSRDRGEADAFENWVEARPKRGVCYPRGRVETEATLLAESLVNHITF